MSSERVIPHTWRGTLSRGLIAACAICAWLSIVPAPTAEAGSYVARECSWGKGMPGAPDAVPYSTANPGYSPVNACDSSQLGLHIQQGIHVSIRLCGLQLLRASGELLQDDPVPILPPQLSGDLG